MKSLENGGSKEDYTKAKQVVCVIFTAKRETLDDKFKQCYQCLLNKEFSWDETSLSQSMFTKVPK